MEPKHLGRFSTKSIQTSLTLPSLQEGVYPLAEGAYFVKIVRGGSLEWVINNTCDHMGNPLCGGGGNTLRCPKHGWVLDLNSLTYTNGAFDILSHN
ncbi:Rieske 2Fe-2S domain-containing protein [Helicobacter bizzozeronii]|uniref:Rieske 2Fe-2S domain-containing protein n=1 Tax=Helicobacter bizzozeronii TaxID=56877 RepID=UPI002279B7F3|nr:Rieske 2Fe-2S domain-containing protein [Helicobacter bizzozeronii]